MKVTLEERFRKKMNKIAKKNILCRILIFPVRTIGQGGFRGLSYCANNGKRFAMLGITMMLFVVYSSFSFPMFVSGAEASGLNEVSQEALEIGLAEENELDMGGIVLLGEQGISDILDNEESNAYIDDKIKETIKETIKEAEYQKETDSDNLEKEVTEQEVTEQNVPEQDALEQNAPEQEVSGQDMSLVFDGDAWNLMLVNKQHHVPDDYEFPMGCIYTDRGAMYCDERTIEPLLAMFEAASKDGVTLYIQSPYRDRKYQELLFNRKVQLYMDKGLSYLEAYQVASTIVTIPGASEHQTGMAFDLLSNTYGSMDSGFGETAAGKWLAAHCHEYGFILRYPAGKQHITDIIYEPWHFRYVGVEAATIIMQEGITLEEFWEEYL